jgi:hypothetical protein
MVNLNMYKFAAFISWLTKLTDYEFSTEEVANITGYIEQIYIAHCKESL